MASKSKTKVKKKPKPPSYSALERKLMEHEIKGIRHRAKRAKLFQKKYGKPQDGLMVM
jgi:hypothetical protein